MQMVLDVSTPSGRKVLAAGRPSGRYPVVGGWFPPRIRLAASDGVSGALEFAAWEHGIRDEEITEGTAILAAVLGDGTEVETEIDLRRVAA